MAYVYQRLNGTTPDKKTIKVTFSVGHWSPKGEWIIESSWKVQHEAVWRVHMLNGGTLTREQVETLMMT